MTTQNTDARSAERPLSVLVTCGGSFQGLTVVKGLRERRGVRIVIADCYADNVSMYFADRLVKVGSVARGQEYIDSLFTVCGEEDVSLVIPATAHDLLLVSKNQESFEQRGVQVAVSPFEVTECFLNKSRTHNWLVEMGLPTLPRLSEITPTAFPMIGKLNHSDGAKGQVVLNSVEDCHERGWTELPSGYLWETLIEDFVEYSIDFAIGFDGTITRPAIRSRASTIVGFAVVCDSVVDESLSSLAEKVVNAIRDTGGVGIFNFQIMSTADGFFISDINPRVGTSSVHTLAMGVNLPSFMCDSMADSIVTGDVDPPARDRPVRMVRTLEEIWIPNVDFSSARGLVFDLDDTLIDQRKWMFAKIEGMVDAMGNRVPRPIEFVTAALQILEEGNRKTWINETLDKCGLPKAMAPEMIDVYQNYTPTLNPAYADVPGALAELTRRGLKLGVLTNNPSRSQKQKLANSPAISHYMDAVVFAYELGHEKPDVDGFLAVAEQLGLPPSSLLMVGDNPYRDVVGAREAGYLGNFMISRARGLCKFDLQLFAEANNCDTRDIVEISDLRQLTATLHSAR